MIIAGVIFILIITIFYTLLVREPKADVEQLKKDGTYIGNKIGEEGSGPCNFMENKEIDPLRVQECYDSDPEEFRKEHNIESKFCIYMVDKSGRLVTVNDKVGFGHEDLQIAGTPCGEDIVPP